MEEWVFPTSLKEESPWRGHVLEGTGARGRLRSGHGVKGNPTSVLVTMEGPGWLVPGLVILHFSWISTL